MDTTLSPRRVPIVHLPNEALPTTASMVRSGGSALCLRQPKPYDGSRTGTACEDWISEMRNYIEFYTVRNEFKTEMERIQAAASFLTDRARKVWNVHKRMHESAPTDSGLQVNTLEDFFKVIKNACTDFNLGERVRSEYNRLRQPRSVGEFAYDLLDLVDQLPNCPPDFEILERFRSGLRNHVTDKVDKILQQPEELVPFIELCDRIDRKWWLCQRQRHSRPEPSKSTVGGRTGRNENESSHTSTSSTSVSHTNSPSNIQRTGYRGRQRIYVMSGPDSIKKCSKEWKD